MPWIQQLQPANWSHATCIALFAYLLGCFTTGYYVVRFWAGQDLRELGSGSVGAKNVGRILGWPGFMTALLGDIAKGALAVWATRHYTPDDRMVALAMVCVVAGHVWPAQLWFHGGKGIATSLGALLIYDYHLIAAFIILFACFWIVLRKMVLPGLFAMACLPLVSMYLADDAGKIVAVCAVAGVVLLAHRKNFLKESFQFVERTKDHHHKL
jgi:glycerol-3-phosphate acyltransferase PlsY